jgi:hypothetical protein
MMTNLYPFLMGMAALKHERSPIFHPSSRSRRTISWQPTADTCVLPQSFSTEWSLQEKVLAIVDDNATAIDAHARRGHHPGQADAPFDSISVVEGKLVGTLSSRIRLPERRSDPGAEWSASGG